MVPLHRFLIAMLDALIFTQAGVSTGSKFTPYGCARGKQSSQLKLDNMIFSHIYM
jgi:hypothetical protein